MRAALPRGLRMALLTAHITAAALWLGMDTALIAITAAHASIPAPLGAAMLTPSAATTLGTGFVLAAHRPWGLRRHHWIVVKVRISAVVTAAGLTSLSGVFDPLSMLAARVCALIALIAAIAVSVTKPWGLTQVGRAAAANRSASGAGKPQIPTHHQNDHLRRTPEPGEPRGHHRSEDAASGTHQPSMTTAPPHPEHNTASTRVRGHTTNRQTV